MITGNKYISSTNSDVFVCKMDSLNNMCNTNLTSVTCTVNTGGTYGTGGTVTTLSLSNGLGGITGTGGTISNICLTTEIFEPNSNNNFSIYPNPSNDNIIIENISFKNGIDEIISIYNVQGQMVLKQTLSQTKTEVDISKISKGLYILKIESKEGTAVKRLIKE